MLQKSTWLILWMKISLGSSPVGSETSNSSPKSQNTRTQMPYASQPMNWQGRKCNSLVSLLVRAGRHDFKSISQLFQTPDPPTYMTVCVFHIHKTSLTCALSCRTTVMTADLLWWGVVVSGRTHSLSSVGSTWLGSWSHTAGESRQTEIKCYLESAAESGQNKADVN